MGACRRHPYTDATDPRAPVSHRAAAAYLRPSGGFDEVLLWNYSGGEMPDFASTVWIHGSHALPSSGYHTITFIVRNVRDNLWDSQLAVDNVQVRGAARRGVVSATPGPAWEGGRTCGFRGANGDCDPALFSRRARPPSHSPRADAGVRYEAVSDVDGDVVIDCDW